MVSAGYLGEEPRSDEWFVTGDLGSIDPEGRLTVLGRAGAVIVTGGENVHPALVERALRTVAGVVDARVSGEPDAEWGSALVAELVLDATTVAAVAAEARGLLRRAEVPRRWIVVDSCAGQVVVRSHVSRARPTARYGPSVWNGRLVRAVEGVVTTESARTTAAGGDEPR